MFFKLNKKAINLIKAFIIVLVLVFMYMAFAPKDLNRGDQIIFRVQKGMGYREIASQLKEQGVINSKLFFEAYVIVTGKQSRLQAGAYRVSPSTSVAEIAQMIAAGKIAKNKITTLDGWTIKAMAKYFQDNNFYDSVGFTMAAAKDYSVEFPFLKDKPKKLGVEGYVFPDTYSMPIDSTPQDFLTAALTNFDQQLTPEMRDEIAKQKKTIFQIVTMASIIEKEANTMANKKLASGVLWKRLSIGMPLQVDSTINYITGKSDPAARLKDTRIESPYNTYLHTGLPLGPIANPGIDSIIAAIYPTKSNNLYYLSKPDGRMIFSATLAEHNAAKFSD